METHLFSKTFFKEKFYAIQQSVYCLDDIEHGILRANGHEPSSWTKRSTFDDSDLRSLYIREKIDPRIHFLLACNTKSSPPVVVLETNRLDDQLRSASQQFCKKNIKILSKEIRLPKVFYWYKDDFGKDENQIFSFFSEYLLQDQKNELKSLMKKEFSIIYDDYDWNFEFPKLFTIE